MFKQKPFLNPSIMNLFPIPFLCHVGFFSQLLRPLTAYCSLSISCSLLFMSIFPIGFSGKPHIQYLVLSTGTSTQFLLFPSFIVPLNRGAKELLQDATEPNWQIIKSRSSLSTTVILSCCLLLESRCPLLKYLFIF